MISENKVNTTAADALAPCAIRSSTAMVLTIYDNQVLFFYEKVSEWVIKFNGGRIATICSISVWWQDKLWVLLWVFSGLIIFTGTTTGTILFSHITATQLKNGTIDGICSAQRWVVEIWQLWMDNKIVAPAMDASQHSPLYAPSHNTYTFHSHSNIWCIAGFSAKSQYISPENKIWRLQHEKGNYITHKENLSVIRMGQVPHNRQNRQEEASQAYFK